jgi:putative Holliday junction resolvase
VKAGRLLGVDYGSRRVGLAVSDPERKIASPLATYVRRTRDQDGSFFKQLAADQEIVELVVGLPVHLSGDEGAKAAEARAFGKWLAEITERAVVYWDERYTTVEAEEHLWSAGLTHKQRKARRDQVAAQVILQTYIDAGCPHDAKVQPHRG